MCLSIESSSPVSCRFLLLSYFRVKFFRLKLIFAESLLLILTFITFKGRRRLQSDIFPTFKNRNEKVLIISICYQLYQRLFNSSLCYNRFLSVSLSYIDDTIELGKNNKRVLFNYRGRLKLK